MFALQRANLFTVNFKLFELSQEKPCEMWPVRATGPHDNLFPFFFAPLGPWRSSANINQVHLKTQISRLSESKNLCICIRIFF